MTGTPASRWKVVVIVEDDSDGQALRKLVGAADLAVDLDWLPAYGLGNIKRRADKLIELAKDRIRDGQGCVAVVVDRDGKDARHDEPHRSIAKACSEAGIPYLEARESFEAWCLADAGIRSWLNLSLRSTVDRIPDPEKRISRAFRKKTKRTYQKRIARLQLVAHATGPEDRRSPSWRQARDQVRECLDGAGG